METFDSILIVTDYPDDMVALFLLLAGTVENHQLYMS